MAFVLVAASASSASSTPSRRLRPGAARSAGAMAPRAKRRAAISVAAAGVAAEAVLAPTTETEIPATKARRTCSRCGQPGHNARTCTSDYFGMVAHLKRRPTFDSCSRCHGAGVTCCSTCRCSYTDEGASALGPVDEPAYDAAHPARGIESALPVLAGQESDDGVFSTRMFLKLARTTFEYGGKVRSEVCHKCGGSSMMVCPECRGLVEAHA